MKNISTIREKRRGRPPQGDVPLKGSVMVNLTPRDKALLAAKSEAKGTSMGAHVRMLILDDIYSYEKE